MLQVTNNKPFTASPLYTDKLQDEFDPIGKLDEMFLNNIFTSINPSLPVEILDKQGTQYGQDEMRELMVNTLDDVMDASSEDKVRDVLSQTLVHYTKGSQPTGSVFVSQSASSVKPPLPEPSPTILYTAGSDIIPSAKLLLSDPSQADTFFVSLAYTYSPPTLGFWFLNDQAFEDFKIYANNLVTTLSNSNLLSAQTTTIFGEFMKMNLKTLTEGIVIRTGDQHNNEPHSFARILPSILFSYLQSNTNGQMGILPFDLQRLIIPHNIVFVNVERHARATPRHVDLAWNLVNKSINNPPKVLSNRALMKLTTVARQQVKSNAQAARARKGRVNQNNRSARVRLRSTPVPVKKLAVDITRVMRRMKEVNRSHNIFKKVKMSYLRANRRDPDNFNKAGKMVSTHYLPDIHIYADTSGSISTENYQDTVKLLIKLARKLNVNLYFSSFSHVLSQETLVNTQGKSPGAIWKQIESIPKVTGGTDYEQIWHYINASAARKQRLSIIITDFEYSPPNRRMRHPKNLYYAPIAVDRSGWRYIVNEAEYFIRNMGHIEPKIPSHLLGMLA